MTDEPRTKFETLDSYEAMPVAAGEQRDAAFDDDATVVRPRQTRSDGHGDGDSESESESESDFDATLVLARPLISAADVEANVEINVETDVDTDATVVRPRPAPEVRAPDHRGDPVPDPDHEAGSTEQHTAASGASAVTGRNESLRRASNLMPRVYAPRPVSTPSAPGPVATAGGGVAAENSRAQLPSLARRERRTRVITLAGYAVTVGVAIAGLWFVATLAFTG